MRSQLEESLALHMRVENIPEPMREYRFHPPRRWRFDFAWPEERIAVEVEGGVWTGGRHTRGKGFIADCDKYNEAGRQHWRVFRFTAEHIDSRDAVKFIGSLFGMEIE